MSHCTSSFSSGISIDPNNSFYDALERFYYAYKPVHANLSALICTAGMILNVANIVVLTRPSMINSINLILTAIAICDIGLMTSYFVFLSHFVLLYTSPCDPAMNSYAWACFQLIHANFSILTHNLSLWLTVAMAMVRYVAVKQKHRTTFNRARIAYPVIGATFTLVLLLCVPNFLTYSVQESSKYDMGCATRRPADNLYYNFTTTVPPSTASPSTFTYSATTVVPLTTSSSASGVSRNETQSQPAAVDWTYLPYAPSTPLSISSSYNSTAAVGAKFPNHPYVEAVLLEEGLLDHVSAPPSNHFSTVDPVQAARDQSDEPISIVINVLSGGRRNNNSNTMKKHEPKRRGATTKSTSQNRAANIVDDAQEKLYWVFFSDAAGSCELRNVSFWIGGIAFKIIPCVLLSIFMGLLLHVLVETSRRRRRLKTSTTSLTGSSESGSQGERTTTMLVLIVFIFLLTEAPQGVLAVLSGVFEHRFYENVYKSLGDMLDLLSLINSCVNFVLYCTMSKKYRIVFCEIFLSQRLLRSANVFYAAAVLKHVSNNNNNNKNKGKKTHKKVAAKMVKMQDNSTSPYRLCLSGSPAGGKRRKTAATVDPLVLNNRATNAALQLDDESEMFLCATRIDADQPLLATPDFPATPTRETETSYAL